MSIRFLNSQLDLGETSVENIFIREYLPMANADQIKVYLTGLLFSKTNPDMSLSQLSYHLGMSVILVRTCFEYWQKMQLIDLVNDDPYNPEIIYRSARELLFSGKQEASTSNDDQLAAMALAIKGSTLNAREYEYLLNFSREMRHGIDIIEIVMTYYYKDYGGGRFTVLEKFFEELKKQDITDLDDVAAHTLNYFDRHHFYKQVMRAVTEKPSSTQGQRKMIDKWLDDFHFTKVQILDYIDEFTPKTSNPNLGFINKLMEDKVTQKNDTFKAQCRILKKRIVGGEQLLTKGEQQMMTKWITELKLSHEELIEKIDTITPALKTPTVQKIDDNLRGKYQQKKSRKKSKPSEFNEQELEERLFARKAKRTSSTTS